MTLTPDPDETTFPSAEAAAEAHRSDHDFIYEALRGFDPEAGTVAERLDAADSATSQMALVAEHGSDSTVARPDFDGVVFWIGTVDPENAEATDVVIKPSAGVSVFESNTRTAGDVAFTSTSWADVDTDLDVTVDVDVGDIVALYINGKWKGGEAAVGFLTVESVNRAANLGSSTNGIPGWQGIGEQPVGSPFFYTVQAGDISDGSATFRLRGASHDGTTRTLKAASSAPLMFSGHVIA